MIGLLASLNVIAWLFFDIKTYQPRLVAAVSEALGMDIVVNGRLGFRLLPGLSVTLPNVRLSNRGSEIVFAQQARFSIALLPLLRRQIQIDAVTLKHPRLTLERGLDGRFNFEKPGEDKDRTLPPLDLAKLHISNASLSYRDQGSGRDFEATDCNMRGWALRLAGGKAKDVLKRLALKGEMSCRELRAQKLVVSDLKLTLKGKKGVFDIKPVSLRFFAAQGEGGLRADFSGEMPQHQLHYSLANLRIEELLGAVSPKPVVRGSADFSARLTLRGSHLEEMKKNLEGTISIRGMDLTYEGTDLDRELAQFESSQRFNLLDAGAFFFAGPFGLAMTKGYSFASVVGDTGGHTDIPMAASDWEIRQGVARAQDVAFATKKYRIALRGEVDLTQERLDNMEMALVDEEGCVKARQKISGTLQEPVIERTSTLKAIAGPALNLFKLGKGKCEMFYVGSVPAPKRVQAAPDKTASE